MPQQLYVRSVRSSHTSSHRGDFSSAHSSLCRAEPPQDCNAQFIAMMNAYRPSGGLARAGEVVALCQLAGSADSHGLGQPTARRKVVCFDWGSTLWIPLFQFDRNDMSLHPGAGHVQQELVGVFNAWEIAVWFSQPNVWLNDGVPAGLLAMSGTEVLNAARAARYVEAG